MRRNATDPRVIVKRVLRRYDYSPDKQQKAIDTIKIRRELRDCGVTESVIYPDLDGIGREITQIWEDRRASFQENR